MNCLLSLQGDFGPFYPQIPVKVPLWLAAALKKRGKCTIRPPQWMSIGEHFYLCLSDLFFFIWHFLVSYNLGPKVRKGNMFSFRCIVSHLLSYFFFPCGLENLTKVLEGEREDRGTFQAVPFHYIEISRLLFDQ